MISHNIFVLYFYSLISYFIDFDYYVSLECSFFIILLKFIKQVNEFLPLIWQRFINILNYVC